MEDLKVVRYGSAQRIMVIHVISLVRILNLPSLGQSVTALKFYLLRSGRFTDPHSFVLVYSHTTYKGSSKIFLSQPTHHLLDLRISPRSHHDLPTQINNTHPCPNKGQGTDGAEGIRERGRAPLSPSATEGAESICGCYLWNFFIRLESVQMILEEITHMHHHIFPV